MGGVLFAKMLALENWCLGYQGLLISFRFFCFNCVLERERERGREGRNETGKSKQKTVKQRRIKEKEGRKTIVEREEEGKRTKWMKRKLETVRKERRVKERMRKIRKK